MKGLHRREIRDMGSLETSKGSSFERETKWGLWLKWVCRWEEEKEAILVELGNHFAECGEYTNLNLV